MRWCKDFRAKPRPLVSPRDLMELRGRVQRSSRCTSQGAQRGTNMYPLHMTRSGNHASVHSRPRVYLWRIQTPSTFRPSRRLLLCLALSAAPCPLLSHPSPNGHHRLVMQPDGQLLAIFSPPHCHLPDCPHEYQNYREQGNKRLLTIIGFSLVLRRDGSSSISYSFVFSPVCPAQCHYVPLVPARITDRVGGGYIGAENVPGHSTLLIAHSILPQTPSGR